MRTLSVVSLVSCSFVLSALACSSGAGGAGDSGGGDACVSRDFEPTSLLAGDALVDVAASGQDAWLLLRGSDGVLAVQKVGGDRRVLEATGTTNAAIANRPDGTICVVWGVGAGGAATVKTACSPSFESVDTGITLPIGKRYPVAYHDDGPSGAAVLFAEYNSLDGLSREGLDAWSDANVMESSISFAGGPRALSGATAGSPLCFVSQGIVVVERWLRSGSANKIGTILTDSGQMFYADVGCAVAIHGETVGVLAVGKGEATLAVRAPFAWELEETPLEAEGITAWSFGATSTHFVAVYATEGDLFRARRPVEGGTIEVTPVALPGDAKVAGEVAVAWAADGAEHLAVATAGRVLVSKTCAKP